MNTCYPPVGPPDVHHLSGAIGWLELGNAAEALLELEKINPAMLRHPDVLEAGWLVLARLDDWESCLRIAQDVVDITPDNPTGWIHRAYATRRVKGGGLTAAYDALLPAAEKFPDEPVIPYNIACYLCRMGKLEECRRWLDIAFKKGDANAVRAMALKDEDLKELWPELKE